MQHSVHYNVEINCDPCPEGTEDQITRQLRTAFPVSNCRYTPTGLSMRLTSGHPFAYGALKDFADLVADTLTQLGIRVSCGVVRLVTREPSQEDGFVQRIKDTTAALVGVDLRPEQETPVLYFYKGMKLDLDIAARLNRTPSRVEVGA